MGGGGSNDWRSKRLKNYVRVLEDVNRKEKWLTEDS